MQNYFFIKKGILLFISITVSLFIQGCMKDESGLIKNLEQLERLDSIISASRVNLNKFYYDKVYVYEIRYYSDDYEVVGYIAAPIDYLKREYPILIYNRGGNRMFGALTPTQAAMMALPVEQDLAIEMNLHTRFNLNPEECIKSGYIILASQYRGIMGGTGIEQFGGDDINDVLRLIDIGENFSFAGQGGVYMAGGSRGGMMTYIASRIDNRIKAAAVGAGISNLIDTYNEREYDMRRVLIDLVGGTPEELPEEYVRRSAIFWADEIDVPLLIVHGGDLDWRVPTHHATHMAEKLEEFNKEYRLIIHEEMDHNLEFQFWLDVEKWFAEYPIN